LRRKNVASSQEVICEQWVRPSHRNAAAGGVAVKVRDGSGVTAVADAREPEEANCVYA
jgi:hypothetical protein